MAYVIDTNKKYVSHIGDEASCRQYISNAQSLFGGSFTIAKTAKERDAKIKELKS